MRLRRPWPFQNWQRGEKFGLGDYWVVAHSRLLARFGRCKCIGCLIDEQDAS